MYDAAKSAASRSSSAAAVATSEEIARPRILGCALPPQLLPPQRRGGRANDSAQCCAVLQRVARRVCTGGGECQRLVSTAVEV